MELNGGNIGMSYLGRTPRVPFCYAHGALFILKTFLAGALYRAISGIHANSDDFPWKNPQKSIIIRVFQPFVLIMMDFCGFFQGKSSEFA